MEVTFMEPHDYNCCCDTKKKEKKNCFGLIATILAVRRCNRNNSRS